MVETFTRTIAGIWTRQPTHTRRCRLSSLRVEVGVQDDGRTNHLHRGEDEDREDLARQVDGAGQNMTQRNWEIMAEIEELGLENINWSSVTIQKESSLSDLKLYSTLTKNVSNKEAILFYKASLDSTIVLEADVEETKTFDSNSVHIKPMEGKIFTFIPIFDDEERRRK